MATRRLPAHEVRFAYPPADAEEPFWFGFIFDEKVEERRIEGATATLGRYPF